MSPVICFGQQPCGIFPRRFLYSKIKTARRLQSEIGGEIVFFYHDSDHDPRETRTLLRHPQSDTLFEINFTFDNKIQKKFCPLYLKRVREDWRARTAAQLDTLLDRSRSEMFQKVTATNVADFCLAMYRQQNLLEGIRVVRSSDPNFRRQACTVSDYYVDVPYEGEVVRARRMGDQLKLHKGGKAYLDVPVSDFCKEQISPTRDSRLSWMQSVVHCSHYVTGAGEQDYLRTEDAPEIIYLKRDFIERSDEAFVG